MRFVNVQRTLARLPLLHDINKLVNVERIEHNNEKKLSMGELDSSNNYQMKKYSFGLMENDNGGRRSFV